MARKTEGVNLLVRDVLATFSEPYGEDVIEDVCIAIEANPHWRQQYDQLVESLSLYTVNNWIGRYTAIATGLQSITQVKAKRTHLIGSYSKLK